MTNFTANLGRKIRGIYKPKSRPGRPAKLQALRNEIDDSQFESATSSPVSSYLASSAADNDEVNASLTSPKEPVSVDAETDGHESVQPETMHRWSGPLENEDTAGPVPTSSVFMPLETDEPYAPDEYLIEAELQELPNAEEVEQQYVEQGNNAVDEQTIREQAYIVIEPEEADDYTDGPPRMVVATDGVKQCPALLMTFDLSAKLQRSLRAQRDFAKAESSALSQVDVIMKYERGVKRQIASRQTRLARLDEHEGCDASGDPTALNEELEILASMLQGAKNRRQAVHSNVQTKGDMLRKIQEDANTHLEEAFVAARLLEAGDYQPSTPIEAIDFQHEYQEYRQAYKSSQGEMDEAVLQLETGKQHLEAAPLSPGQQAVADLKQAFWSAEQRLKEAQIAFSRRGDDRKLEWQANYEAVERGEEATDDSPETFDLRWVKRNQELTREVLDAEAAVAEAKTMALAANIDIAADDTASGFVDDVADGYRMSFEQAQIDSVPGPKVSNWLSNIPDQASPTFNDRLEVDDNWETQTVDVNDSVSMVAEDPERRRIDKWKRACGF